MGGGTKSNKRVAGRGSASLRLAEVDVGAPRSGDVFAGKYTIKRLLGRGGMGNVYLASAGPGEPDIALKMLADRWLDDSDAVARFEREVSHLRSIDHPNIVALYDSGVDRGRPYLTMEYIDGEPLSDYLSRKGPLSLTEFVPIAAQMLKGMGYAHLREMMIRDVKPSNIMLCTRKGRANFVKILDFGLAKLTSGEAPLTEGGVLGTAGYLAPEAIRGEALDLRVDVYAIGVAFYHMLAGVLPFGDQENATVLYKTLDEPPRPLDEVRGEGHGLPKELLELIDDCLAKDRADRPDDANIVVERLIDAVPVAYFRLPSATASARVPGFGNTGLIELVRSNPSVRIPTGGSTLPKPAPKKRRAKEWAVIAAIACIASLVTVFAVTSLRGGDDDSGVAAASVIAGAPSGSTVETDVDATPPPSGGTRPAPSEPSPGTTLSAAPAPAQPGPTPTDASPEVSPAALPSVHEPSTPRSRPVSKRRRSPSSKPRNALPSNSGPQASTVPEHPAPAEELTTRSPAATKAPLRPATPPAPKEEPGGVFLSASRSNDEAKKAKRGGLLKAAK